jgi:hypothetical protein
MTHSINQDTALYRLIPKPIIIHEKGIAGRLFVYGNLAHNYLMFCFRFDRPVEVSPLFLDVKINDKTWRYLCGIRDLTNPEMKTPILSPDFNIGDGIKTVSLEPVFQAGNPA